MKKRIFTNAAIIALMAVLFTTDTVAQPYYSEDFESGIPAAATRNPDWTINPIWDNFIGPGNIFELSTTSCNSGNNSMRFNYNGRNGFCNTCGTYAFKHIKTGFDNASDFIIADTGEDLTAPDNPATLKPKDGPAAAPGRLVYNKTNGWSKWEVVSVVNQDGGTNNRLNVKLVKAGIGGQVPEFNGGDNILIARQCGVDGHVGQDINRRNDCDGAISWFNGDPVNGNYNSQAPGTSIWRRIYLKSEITSKVIHQKLHYWRTNNQAKNANNATIYLGEVVPVISNEKGRPLELQMAGFQHLGGINPYRPEIGNFPQLTFERGKWFYLEEEYKAATEAGIDTTTGLMTYNSDGAYRLWFSESSTANVNDPPVFEVTGLHMAPLRDRNVAPNNSLWGNMQHWEHSRGSWYIDDLEITADGRIGPKAQTCNDTSAPKAPTAR